MTTPTSLTPIARQPTTNLALVCRYLTGPELIACYQTNHLLSSAASHPLTFQQETKIGVIADLNQCRFYANGPTAIFRTSQQMRQAFQSQLFKHFKIVHLKANEQQLQDYIQALTEPNTPPLRAITLTLPEQLGTATANKQDQLKSSEDIIIDYSNAPALKYLTAVHLIDPHARDTRSELDPLLQFLPLSTEILHLTLNFRGVLSTCMKVLVDRLLLPNNQINQLIVDGIDSHPTNIHHLVELSHLHQQSRNIDSLQIHWKVPINGFDLASSHRSHTDQALDRILSDLKLTQIVTIQMVGDTVLSASGDCGLSHLLSVVPRLSRLTINLMSMSRPKWKHRTAKIPTTTTELSPNLPILMLPNWPTTVQQFLQELKITFDVSEMQDRPQFHCFVLFLTEAKLINLNHLELSATHAVKQDSLQALFQSMPRLTRLSMNNLILRRLDDFAFAPNLVTISSFTWSSALVIPKSCNSWAHLFPSLQTLSVLVAHEPLPTIYADLFNTVPNLRRLKWQRLPWMHPNEINKYAAMEIERIKRVEAQREADLREREERLKLVKEKGVRATASIDAIAPSVDELRSFFSRLDYSAQIETPDKTAARLRRTHITPKKPTTETTFIATEPFVLTPPPPTTTTNPMNDSTLASIQLTSSAFSFNSTPFSLTSPAPATSSTNSSTQPTPTSTLDHPNPFSLHTPQPSLSTSASVFITPTSTSSMGGFSSSKKIGGGRKSAACLRTTGVGQSSTPSTAATATSPAFVFQTNASTVDESPIAAVTNPFVPPSFENSSSTTATNAPSFSAAAFSFPIITPKRE